MPDPEGNAIRVSSFPSYVNNVVGLHAAYSLDRKAVANIIKTRPVWLALQEAFARLQIDADDMVRCLGDG